jgi:hypothetical protein
MDVGPTESRGAALPKLKESWPATVAHRGWPILAVASLALNVGMCASQPWPFGEGDTRNSPDGRATAETWNVSDWNPLTRRPSMVRFKVHPANADRRSAVAEITPAYAQGVDRDLVPDVTWSADGQSVQLKFDTGEVSLRVPRE